MKNTNRMLIFLFVILGLTITSGCKKNSSSVPVLTTTDVTQITENAATSGGTITSDGGSTITSRGVCWGANTAPTISTSKTSDGTGTGAFISNITGLSANSTQHVRAYATNDAGTGYGNEISFTTSAADTIAKDPDGNIYHFVTIGTQVWMVENLKTTKFANGTPIGTTTPATLDISSEAMPVYEWAPNGDESLAAIYGRLYTGFAVTNQNVCPIGWHVPTDAEWTALTDYLGGVSVAGGKLKEAGLAHWQSPNGDATNSTGFKGLPGGGGRDPHGTFDIFGLSVGYWSSSPDASSTSLWDRYLGYLTGVVHVDATPLSVAFYVRCLKSN